MGFLMNQYLYTVQVVRVGMLQEPTQEEVRIAKDHLAYMQGLFDEGIGIFNGAIGVRDSRHFGLVVYEAEDNATAAAIVHNDPAVKNRIMRGCWYPFRVALWNPNAMTTENGHRHFLYHIQQVRPEALTEGPTEFERNTVVEHFMFLQDLTQKGMCSIVGRTQNNDYTTFGMAILRTEDLSSAWQISKRDPAVINRVMRLDVQPFEISMWNRDFSLD